MKDLKLDASRITRMPSFPRKRDYDGVLTHLVGYSHGCWQEGRILVDLGLKVSRGSDPNIALRGLIEW